MTLFLESTHDLKESKNKTEFFVLSKQPDESLVEFKAA
jgi:hypothetical protein